MSLHFETEAGRMNGWWANFDGVDCISAMDCDNACVASRSTSLLKRMRRRWRLVFDATTAATATARLFGTEHEAASACRQRRRSHRLLAHGARTRRDAHKRRMRETRTLLLLVAVIVCRRCRHRRCRHRRRRRRRRRKERKARLQWTHAESVSLILNACHYGIDELDKLFLDISN